MRLIDVSVLKEWVENWFTKNRFYHPYAKNNNIPITELYDILDRMPTIERKTGKWISDTDDEPVVIKDGSPDKSCHCSECGEWLVASDEYDIKGNFCPNCGADMKGET